MPFSFIKLSFCYNYPVTSEVYKSSFSKFYMKKEEAKHLINRRTFGEKAADMLTNIAGSWTFIIIFLAFLAVWIALNGYIWFKYELGNTPMDPYPFILLNLMLSCIAAIQAPIILMSQNREAKRDRLNAEYDYRVNVKAEKEIEVIKKQLDRIETNLSRHIKK